MRVITALSLSQSSLLLTFLFAPVAIGASIWHVSIDNGPAPAPEDGPPLSAAATRDRALLPVQIGSIFGAYFLSILIIGTALLFVGHRFRRAAQTSPRSLDMEMVKPQGTNNAFDPSPVSPRKNRPYEASPVSMADSKSTWPSPVNKSKSTFSWSNKPNGHPQHASKQGSVVTFDESVIEDDRARNQQEMERLYAAVMEHDAEQTGVVYDGDAERSPANPPELQHLRQPLSSPTKQDVSAVPSRSATASPPANRILSRTSRPSPISLGGLSSHSRTSSRTSFGSFGRKKSARGLPISPPMGSPDLAEYGSGAYGDQEPLSPRYYNPGPPPPTPGSERANQNPVHTSAPTSPRRTGLQTPQQQRQSKPDPQERSQPTSPRDPPPPHPETLTQQPSPPRTRRQPAPLNLPLRNLTTDVQPASTTPKGTPRTTTITATNRLPLRNPHAYTNPMSPTSALPVRPLSTIQSTVLEARRPDHHHHHHGGGGAAPLRSALGVPATPYSPYMPFTPLTPVTPMRLVTREERKRREREEGRRVLSAEDEVLREGEVWGDGYA